MKKFSNTTTSGTLPGLQLAKKKTSAHESRWSGKTRKTQYVVLQLLVTFAPRYHLSWAKTSVYRRSQRSCLQCTFKVIPASSKANSQNLLSTAGVPLLISVLLGKCGFPPIPSYTVFNFQQLHRLTAKAAWQQGETYVGPPTDYTQDYQPCSESRCLQGTVTDYDYT